MEAQRRKVYVEVEVTHRVDGTARPNIITFENGVKYEIDRVVQRCRAASTKVGGTVQETKVYRIEPELFLSRVLGLNVGYIHLSYDNSLLGLTSFEEVVVTVLTGADEEENILLDGNTVLVESDLQYDSKLRGRKNFTLMHEGSHQIFKKLFPNEYSAVKNRTSPVRYYRANSEKGGRIRDWEEWQANALASAALLPKSLIMQGMYLFGLGEQIDCLNKIFRPAEFERFSALADFLGCSKKALAIRMKQLGLVKKEYLDNPYDMVTVYM